jgi:hypothetical protein
VSNEGRRVTGERAGLADFGEWARPGSTRNIHFSKPFRSAPSQLTRQPNTSLVSKERRKTESSAHHWCHQVFNRATYK